MTMRKYFAIIMMACILITGCGSAKAEQTAVEATTEQTAVEATTEQAQPADTSTTTAEQATTTAEQAAPAQADTAGGDSVIIVFDDGVEVVAVKDGDVYRCTSSNGHTFKYEGEEIAPGRYLISDEAVKSWSGLLLFDRKVNGW